MLVHAKTLCSIAAALTLFACGGDGGGDSSLTIDNASSYTLLEINLSPVDEVSWGPDLLGSDTLEPGDTLVIADIDCDTYDVRILDETGAECILTDVDLCFEDAAWLLDDTDLAICAFGV